VTHLQSVEPTARYPGAPQTFLDAISAGMPLRTPRWGIPDIVYTLVGALIFGIIGVALAIALQNLVGLSLAWSLILGLVTPWIAIAGWPLLVTTWRGNGPRIDLGLRITWLDVGWGVVGGVVSLIGSGLVALLLMALVGDFTSSAGEVAADITRSGPFLAVLIFALLLAVGAPIVEEIAFRGLGYGAIVRRGLHPAWAITITTILFAAFHLEPTRMPILLVSGAVMGVLRWYTKGLGAPIIAHAVNNTPGALFLLVA
jgi:uncharacterized protein